jgi:hypothetical protein
MRVRNLAAAVATAAGIASLGLPACAEASTAAGAAAVPSGAAEAYTAPRGLDGNPDISGVWQVLNTAQWDIEPHGSRAALAFRDGPVRPVPAREVVALGAVGAVPAGPGVVEGGTIPYTPEALARRNENRAQWLQRDPEIKCYLPGVPRANYMGFPFQILQSDKAMLFAYEYAGAVRNIELTDPGEAPIESWMGQSYGRWEGETFVVEVTGQNDQTWFDRAGNHHSVEMKVVERYTPTSPHTMRYEAEITDPQTFTRPWKMSMTLYRRVGEDARLQQFKCVEHVEELLYGHLRKTPLD